MNPRIAIYPGTFDPMTNGHFSVAQRALSLFDTVIFAIADGSNKRTLFSIEERMTHIRAAIENPRLQVETFSGLLVDYAKKKNAVCLIRGLRAVGDFEYEFQMAHMNHKLGPELETVFLMTDKENFYISSSVIKEAARLGGDISGLVPNHVERALREKFASM